MKISFYKYFICLFLVAPIFVFAKTPIELYQEQIKNLTTFKADIRQVTTDTNDNIIQKTKGNLVLKRPDHIIWINTHPYEQQITSNGKMMWVYDQDLDQVIIHKNLDNIRMSPIYLLTDIKKDLDKYFTIKHKLKPGVREFIFESLTEESDFYEVVIHFKQNKLDKIFVKDKLDNYTTIYFENIKQGMKISNKEFDFEIPEDVDVIE